MGFSARTVRIATATVLALAVVALAAPSAGAVFHLMKVREVYAAPGTTADFVELQMTAAGQNQTTNHEVDIYGSSGPVTTVPLSNVPQGDNQRTILIGDATGIPGGVTPDVSSPIDLAAGGGAVCFPDGSPPDCVLWGTATPTIPNPQAAAAPAMDGSLSLTRSIAANCMSLLEGADDTDNSAADFQLTTPSPQNNAATPTETACGGGNPDGGPDTKIDKGPKKKTKKKKATFVFSSTPVGATFECSLDGNAPKGAGSFGACTSPYSVRVKKGKHSFRVRAVLNGVPDGSPAERSWKVKKPKR
jgi:hypothetical protein